MALPSGGAVLQRVTVVTSRPDETLVLLRADYASPGTTYEGIASSSTGTEAQTSQRGNTALPATLPGQNSDTGTGTAYFGSELSGYLAPAAQYARTQSRSLATATPKGATIDVHA